MEEATLVATVVIGILTIAAIVMGPIWALQIQRKLDREREAKQRELNIFKTLLTYRATPLNPLFVQALNLIDVEFDENTKEQQRIRDAWKELLDHFGDLGKEEGTAGRERSAELAAELLVAMGEYLGYHFDKVYIKKSAYLPKGHVDVELEQQRLRQNVLELFEGRRRLPVAVFKDEFPPLKD